MRWGLVVAALLSPAAAQSQAALDDSDSSADGWNFSYRIPAGWRVAQVAGPARILGSAESGEAIFVAPGLYRSADEAEADLSAFYSSLELEAFPVEPPSSTTIAGLPATVATYTSQNQSGGTVQGRYVFLRTPYGTGLILLGVTSPERMPRVRAVVEQLAAGVRAGPPAIDRRTMAAMEGTWVHSKTEFSGGTSSQGSTGYDRTETVVFDGQGGYQWESTSMMTISTPGYTADANSTSSDSDQGSYTVIGNSLVLKGTKGQLAFELDFRGDVILANGKAYRRR
jgi:hypothetical protein